MADEMVAKSGSGSSSSVWIPVVVGSVISGVVSGGVSHLIASMKKKSCAFQMNKPGNGGNGNGNGSEKA